MLGSPLESFTPSGGTRTRDNGIEIHVKSFSVNLEDDDETADAGQAR